MKTNKKGFTLIELLAVIVILAVIALIAVPQILNILNNARRSAAEDSAYGILQAAETFAATYMLDHHGDALLAGTTFSCDGTKCEVGNYGTATAPTTTTLSFKGTIPTKGQIVLDAEGNATIVDNQPLKINNFYCNEATSGNTAVINCNINASEVASGVAEGY